MVSPSTSLRSLFPGNVARREGLPADACVGVTENRTWSEDGDGP